MAAGGAACLLLDLLRARANGRSLLRPLASYLAAGAALAALTALAWRVPSPLLQMLASLALVAALGPIVYRLTIEPNPANSTVVLVIIGVGVSMIMHPLALLLGRRSARRAAHQRGAPGTGRRRHRGAVAVHHGLLAGGRPGAVPVLPLHPVTGGACAVNREGAQYCGIPVVMAGRLSYFLAAALSGASGMLLAPLVTAHYEMGFVVGLKGFVGAAMGGLVNYPLSVAGVFIVGVLESFASFLSSSYRDALVFAMVIPILLWRNSRAGADLDEH